MITKVASVFVNGQRARRYGYSAEWVNRLHRSIARNLPSEWAPHHVCLTDTPNGVDFDHRVVEPVDIGDWWDGAGLVQGWWAKVKLFDAETFEPGERVLYCDIDNLVIGDLGPLVDAAAGHSMACAPMTSQNFRRHDPRMERSISSAFMIWTAGEPRAVYDDWSADAALRLYGDQDWIGHKYGDRARPLDRAWFLRGTRLIRRGWGRRGDARVVFCSRQKCDEFVRLVPQAEEHWT